MKTSMKISIELLENMLDEMSKFHRSKDELMSLYVSKRLEKSLQTYYEDLSESVSYLDAKNSMKVLKGLNRW